MGVIDMGLVRGVIVVLSLGTFLGICWWAYRPANKRRFEADAFLVFEGDEAELERRAPSGAQEDER